MNYNPPVNKEEIINIKLGLLDSNSNDPKYNYKGNFSRDFESTSIGFTAHRTLWRDTRVPNTYPKPFNND